MPGEQALTIKSTGPTLLVSLPSAPFSKLLHTELKIYQCASLCISHHHSGILHSYSSFSDAVVNSHCSSLHSRTSSSPHAPLPQVVHLLALTSPSNSSGLTTTLLPPGSLPFLTDQRTSHPLLHVPMAPCLLPREDIHGTNHNEGEKTRKQERAESFQRPFI